MAARLIGIDLGTTNSAVAWLDASASAATTRPRLFRIPQLVASGEVAARTTLPSFLYIPTPQERESGALALPWEAHPPLVAGVFAREHGALVPTRQVSSAKSWLSNAAVERRAPLLPWAADDPRMSPVEASQRLLEHLRDAWNYAEASNDPSLRLEDQTIVLTVPASFDQEARELTVDAARDAGFVQLTLIEEPIAAVYAWIAAHPRGLSRIVGDGHVLLVCDVGGGTTDFSLIRAYEEHGAVRFERIAIGEHLLLGGDNVDVALAALIERKLLDTSPGARLDLTQRQILRRRCSAAKERLLSADAPDAVPVTLLGAGRGLVGGALTTALTREEVQETLDRFLPMVGRDDRPARHTRAGLRELGLPYESDPAITRHLAAFLARGARVTFTGAHASARRAGDDAAPADMIRPDAVLFNGGFFTPDAARARVLDALASWFGSRPEVLANGEPESAVAIGAAYYAGLRHNPAAASRLLIRAGSPRSYYVAVESAGRSHGTTAVCVLQRGTQEGTRVVLERPFSVIANQPAAFTLLSSAERSDAPNDVVTFPDSDDDDGTAHRHAPLVTALRYGQRSRRVPLDVRLSLLFTEVGTIELWCESVSTDHRWRLQFNLRAHEKPGVESPGDGEQPAAVVIGDNAIAAAEQLLRDTFTSADRAAVDALTGELENTLGHGKHAWPLPVLRRLADVLLALPDGRRLSARHEARWLNLVGFCMRPGFGTSLDPWRVAEVRKVYAADLAYPRDVQNQAEWLILWQRVSAGFTAPQQQELATRLTGLLGLGARKAPRVNPQVYREAWRLLAGLERLDRQQRARLGDELIERVRRDSQNSGLLWAIGRLGARVPAYGPLNSVVAASAAERWLDVIVTIKSTRLDTQVAIAEMAARVDDPARDVADAARDRAAEWLEAADAPDELIEAVRAPAAAHHERPALLYGEPLPQGLRIHTDLG